MALNKILNIRCQSPKYENGLKHLWHLASSNNVCKNNDEDLAVTKRRKPRKLRKPHYFD